MKRGGPLLFLWKLAHRSIITRRLQWTSLFNPTSKPLVRRDHISFYLVKADPYEFNETWCPDRAPDVDYNGKNGLALHMVVWPVKVNRVFRCREADSYDFNESWCSGTVAGVDSNCEVRLTLHMIVWRQAPNRCRQRQIRFRADPYDFNETRCNSAVSDVDSNGEFRFTDDEDWRRIFKGSEHNYLVLPERYIFWHQFYGVA